MSKRERTPPNAPGPFFTERHCCISCHAPEPEAPDLMAFDEEEISCYFRRQPETPEEVERACQAVWASCCGAVVRWRRSGHPRPASRVRVEACAVTKPSGFMLSIAALLSVTGACGSGEPPVDVAQVDGRIIAFSSDSGVSRGLSIFVMHADGS